ncbi:hypothetical protein B296_00016979 [Ensete ventricosum]|uniref:Dilute domain-containing protein n=1 Tax=Ensete ventricosum TaxID=4639 RepID=A0A427AK56_ENSVE|nr:hypothetical protein B296_00016979 [Ensete ventricosum]
MGGLSDLRQVEAKYPALLFKQQLTAFLEKIYGMIRDNLKKEISSLLALCIQKPKKTLKEITNDLCPVWATTLTCYDVKNMESYSYHTHFELLSDSVFRCLAYNSYTESVRCTGMTNMEHTVFHRR